MRERERGQGLRTCKLLPLQPRQLLQSPALLIERSRVPPAQRLTFVLIRVISAAQLRTKIAHFA